MSDQTTTPSVRFHLADIYTSFDDPKINEDLDSIERLAKEFQATFKDKLKTSLGEALETLIALRKLTNKIFVYLHLCQACDAANPAIQRAQAKAGERWASVSGNYLLFFEHEVGTGLSDEDYKKLLSDNRVQHHKSFLDQIRKKAKHLLSPEVERALTLRQPYGPEEWHDYLDEVEVEARFTIKATKLKGHDFWGKKLSMTQILNLMLHHEDREVRFEAMKTVNRTLEDEVAPITARALNVMIGAKNLEDAERGFQFPMESRHIDNRVSKEVVDALHTAVATEGAAQAKRYYKLLAKLLNLDTLRWSDRTARLPMGEKVTIPWNEATKTVYTAWSQFSPTLAHFVKEMVEKRWVDADVYEGKSSGAFNYTAVMPAPQGDRTYTFMNYMGTERDVMTLAHEFGHAVHGLLAAQAQGPLMVHAPLAYAETASIFGEMLVFEHLLGKAPSPRHELALLMEKSSDFINSVVRQISFSMFEQKIHTERKNGKLLVKDFCTHWMDITSSLYGKKGEIFDYTGIDYLWSYISHFLNPFYVYAYAFGELLTQSLFGARGGIGKDFEPRYLDLLRAGSTKNAVELLAPFGLNPEDPDFWRAGIRNSIGKWLDRAEKLAEQV